LIRKVGDRLFWPRAKDNWFL